MGAFATRLISAGSVIGVYWGELLTQREHALRHGWRCGLTVDKVSKREQAALAEREARLASYASGRAPVHGARNGSAYCFALFPEELSSALGSAMLPRRAAFVDSEDPERSSWCRYINHARPNTPACNLVSHTDGYRALVWFEAARDIAVGEEICFDYGLSYRWDTPGSGGAPVRSI